MAAAKGLIVFESFSEITGKYTRMRRKKELLARTMSNLGLLGPATLLRSLFRTELKILAYHRVLDSWDEESFAFDPDLISASVDEFQWQMKYIQQHYTPLTFGQLLSSLGGANSLPPRPIIVTFDDGFDDNYLHAFSVLKSLKVPATIFISTGYIGQSRTFWFDWLYFLCNQAAEKNVPVRFGDTKFYLSVDFAKRRTEIAMVLAHVKRIPDVDLRLALEAIEKELGVEIPTGGFSQSRPMSWDQVREMAACGIEFGSHTVNHPILANLAKSQLVDELQESKKTLEQHLKTTIDVIAYPVGGQFAYNSLVVDAVRNAGYKLAASYIPGVNNLKCLETYGLRRLHVERYTTRDSFMGMLALPELLA